MSQNPQSPRISEGVTFWSHRLSMKLALFYNIKTYSKKLKREMYEASETNENFTLSVPSIHFAFIELNTTCDIWNGIVRQFETVICTL